MLRITPTVKNPETVCLKLEGKIFGEWVDLLGQECRSRLPEPGVIYLDFSDVSYIDSSGVEMVRKLLSDRIEVIECPPLIMDLLRNGDNHGTDGRDDS